MRLNCWYVGAGLALLVSPVSAQEQPCPEYSNQPALLRFLQDHRSNSVEADPMCVLRAFGALSHDKAYMKALVELLDFERDYSHDEKLIFRGNQYPAVGALGDPTAIPYLIKAIEENDNEVVQDQCRGSHRFGLQKLYPDGHFLVRKGSNQA